MIYLRIILPLPSYLSKQDVVKKKVLIDISIYKENKLFLVLNMWDIHYITQTIDSSFQKHEYEKPLRNFIRIYEYNVQQVCFP